MRALALFGRPALALFAGAGRVIAFAPPAALRALGSGHGARAAVSQAVSIVARCAAPVVLVCGPIGAMLALQGLTLMRTFGVERALAPLCVATIVRELAPGFAAVVVAMQGGAGIAAELGAMRAADELDALEVMGIDPRAEVAGPRILGAAVAAPLLNGLAMLCGVVGAWVMAVPILGVPNTLFLGTALDGVTAADVWLSAAKTVLFGAALGAVCASAGFFAERSAAGVGRAANRAVVASVILVLVFNYLCNTAIFGLRGGALAL
ncbi:MAG: ABC transporter permease [Deltaproteobacteria bacterium]|nr:ABC transporter permease [Deltaproteobacteria bacterium]